MQATKIAWIVLSLVTAFASMSAQEFSADMISRSADGKVTKSKLYLTLDKTRFDTTVEIKPGTRIETRMIIDRREKLIYLIEPQQKRILVNHALQGTGNASMRGPSASASPCEELMGMINPAVVKYRFACRRMGHETVNGRSTEKWEMDSQWMTGSPAYLWVDSQIKTAIKWRMPDGSSGELQDLKIGAQPASLFILPGDYRKQDLPQ